MSGISQKKIWYEIYKLRAKPQNVGIALTEFLLVSFPRGKNSAGAGLPELGLMVEQFF